MYDEELRTHSSQHNVFRESLRHFEEGLYHQEIEVAFKYNHHYYPEKISRLFSPYMCELLTDNLRIIKFNPQSIKWQTKQQVILSFTPEDILSIQLGRYQQVKFSSDSGIIPTNYLAMTIKFNNTMDYQLRTNDLAVEEIIKEWCIKNHIPYQELNPERY